MIEAEHLSGSGTPVVLLHAGVADSRSWRQAARLIEGATYTYDRRGFGTTPPSQEPFTHLDDLFGVLNGIGPGPAWLVGNSMGGALALDAALTAPDRVAGLVLIAPGVSGEPEPEELDEHTGRLIGLLETAWEAGDEAEINRLETWLWLDGPAGPEGRVGGPARALALAMSAQVLAHGAPDEAGDAGLDAFSRLEELSLPVTIAVGDLDAEEVQTLCRTLAARIPGARLRVLDGVAHLPSLERPAEVADLVNDAIRSAA
jgi:pimeloyl-ACP methyl ester carboxylesterase